MIERFYFWRGVLLMGFAVSMILLCVVIALPPDWLDRKWKLFKAHFVCWIYLLRWLWYGYCKLTAHDEHGRIILIAAVTGSVAKQTLEIKRIFFGNTLDWAVASYVPESTDPKHQSMERDIYRALLIRAEEDMERETNLILYGDPSATPDSFLPSGQLFDHKTHPPVILERPIGQIEPLQKKIQYRGIMFKVNDMVRATKRITRRDMVCALREGEVARITSVYDCPDGGQIVAVEFEYEGKSMGMIDIVCQNDIPLQLA